ncbi:MAG: hypothetical protein H6721_07680 [Sandaracinus sp.]|nr:hypothetical protein [Sandaracinus sp.]MCB9617820.1 hypothetical protein [Sandaracinus sp.]MCB9632000.1 hypothetical protein [Sandaracinus sp.]
MRTRFFLLPLLCLAFVACGDDDGMVADGGIVPDTGTGRPVPFGITVTIAPPRPYYALDQAVRVTAVVTDVDGNEIDIPVSFRAEPATAATPEGEPGVFTLAQEGFVELYGCTDDPGPTGEPMCDFARILVDQGSPTLVVTSPLPGAELGGDESTRIVVEGSVSDTRDVTVFVNGAPAEMGELGTFRAEVVPTFGINHLDVSASDEISDVSRVRMDVLWAERYAPATEGETPTVVLPDGITLQLGQGFFDDGVALDPAVEPPMTRDLADVLELVLRNVDFGGFLPDPVIDSRPTLFLRVTDTRISDLDVNLDVIDGGAELFVRIGALEADTTGALQYESTMLSLDGGLVASLSAYARLMISKDGPEAPLEASIEDLTIAIEGIEGRFEAAEANAVLRLAEGLLRTTLERELADAFGSTLLDTIPAVLTDALSSIDTALQDQTIPIDTGIFPAVTLNLDGRLAGLTTEYRRWMRAPLQLSVSTDATASHPDSRGAADLIADADPLFRGRPVQAGIKVGLLNGLLHTLWNSGMLEIDATTLLPEGVSGAVMQALLSGKLPPVIRPARADEPYDLILSLGQAELLLEALGDTTTYGMTLEAGVNASVTAGVVTLEIAEEPYVRTWIIESTSERPLINEDALRALVLDELWPSLREAVAGGLALELPALSIGDLGGIAPSLTGFELSFELEDDLDVREDSLVLDVAIVGTTPPTMPAM